MMSPTQGAVFQAGSGVAPDVLLTAIASVVMVLAFVWVIWITFGTFRAWQDGQASILDVSWGALRASIVLMVLGFYLR
jgi:integrating conjugative element protein (TIGR03758 family)